MASQGIPRLAIGRVGWFVNGYDSVTGGLRLAQIRQAFLDRLDFFLQFCQIRFQIVTTQVSLRGAFFATKQSPRNNSGTTILEIASQKSLAMTLVAE